MQNIAQCLRTTRNFGTIFLSNHKNLYYYFYGILWDQKCVLMIFSKRSKSTLFSVYVLYNVHTLFLYVYCAMGKYYIVLFVQCTLIAQPLNMDIQVYVVSMTCTLTCWMDIK